ncbi:RNA-directed DNA polymerase, eukaryota [Tanacetum coccineum]
MEEGVGSSSQVEEEDLDEVVESFDASENEEAVPINEVILDSFKAGKEEQNKHEPEVVMEGNVEENDTRKESYDNLMKKVHEHEKDQDASTEKIGSTTSFNIQGNKFKLLKKSLSSGSLIEVFGDFNAVRHEYERSGMTFCRQTLEDFNRFIINSDLVELQIGGRRFTRVDKHCTRMAKLDHFLMSNGLVDKFPNMVGTVLPRLWLDHCLIVLKQERIDYGPIPFKLFNSWSLLEGYDQVVRDAWNEITQHEGDGSRETRYYETFGGLRKEGRKAAINGVMEDGTWISDPGQVKDRFCTFFHEKIKHFNGNRMVTPSARMMKLSDEQYKIVAKLLANRMVKVIDDLVHPVQSAFVKGRQILDSSMVVNEVIECPTNEIQLQRGLRQGDPFSPFLFILAMEGLHIAMEDAIEHDIFRDIRVGPGEAHISHVFYADDAMFMGEWDAKNGSNFITILNCFYLISGLRINLHKSKLYGVGVSLDEVKEFSSNTCCSVSSLPFTYLGLPVGCNIRRISSWEDMISKVQKKLSTWKIKLLSIGGRLTLIKSVLGSLGVYFMSMFMMPEVVNKKIEALRAQFFWGGDDVDRKISWVQWSQVLNSKENGGVGIDWSENEDVWRWKLDHEGEYSMMEDKNGSVAYSGKARSERHRFLFSIVPDSYDDLKKAFLESYLQQKKCIKDPIEIHSIKQREGESTEDFVKRYKLESRDVKGAPECMRISRFVHGITNPELIKRLHDKIPKTVDEMIRVTTSFLRGGSGSLKSRTKENVSTMETA